jgi:hypothetical protein
MQDPGSVVEDISAIDMAIWRTWSNLASRCGPRFCNPEPLRGIRDEHSITHPLAYAGATRTP